MVKINSYKSFCYPKNSTDSKCIKTTNKSFKTDYSVLNNFCYYGQDLVNKKNFKALSFKSNNDYLPKDIKDILSSEYSIDDLINMAIKSNKKLGVGANSTVYELPFIEDYVLKVLNKDDPNKVDISQFPLNRNLGQPVWQSSVNPKLLILKKVSGEEHSINNWSNVIWDEKIKSPKSITKEQSQIYFNKISQIAKMDQEVFNSLAYDVKTLEDMGYKLDSINPNNLIVDTNKNQIHVIDYFKVNPKEKEFYQNSALDITSLILDFTLLPEYYDKLSKEQQDKLIEYIGIINEKVYKGAQKAGLSCDDEKYKTYIRTTSKWFPIKSVPKENSEDEYIRAYHIRLNDFILMLKDPKKWAKEHK